MRIYISAVLVLGASGSWGCAAELDASDHGGGGSGARTDESVASTTQTLTTCDPVTNCSLGQILQHVYTVNDSVATGPSSASHICWPIEIRGHYAGGGPNMRVYQSNGAWKASGTGTMACVKQCCFSSNGGGSDVRWLSGNFTTTSTGYGWWSSTEVWWKDAVTILQGMKGNVSYAWGFINYNPNYIAPNYLYLYTPSYGVETYANSWFGSCQRV